MHGLDHIFVFVNLDAQKYINVLSVFKSTKSTFCKGLRQRRCEALPTMHCDLGATLYIIDFSALVAHCSAGLRSVPRSFN